MKEKLQYEISAFEKHHVRDGFSCGVESLDNYLCKQISQDIKRKSTAGYMLAEINSTKVLGYYTLSSASVDVSDLSEEFPKKLPRYPTLPATLLGRLAVDKRVQGENLGEYLLVDGLRRCLSISEQIGSVAVIVQAINTKAVKFYKNYEFTPFESCKSKLYIPMKTISQFWGQEH